MVGDIHMCNPGIPHVQLLILEYQAKGVADVTKMDVNGHFPYILLFLQKSNLNLIIVDQSMQMNLSLGIKICFNAIFPL